MSETLTLKEKANILRTASELQTAEVDRRLTWMCQLEGFLFAALSFAWDKAKDEPFILFAISSLGLAASALVFKSMLCISRSEDIIRRDWQQIGSGNQFGYHQDAVSNPVGKPNYLSPHNMLPLLFVLGWLFVMLYGAFCFGESCRWRIFVVVVLLCLLIFGLNENRHMRRYRRQIISPDSVPSQQQRQSIKQP